MVFVFFLGTYVPCTGVGYTGDAGACVCAPSYVGIVTYADNGTLGGCTGTAGCLLLSMAQWQAYCSSITRCCFQHTAQLQSPPIMVEYRVLGFCGEGGVVRVSVAVGVSREDEGKGKEERKAEKTSLFRSNQ